MGAGGFERPGHPYPACETTRGDLPIRRPYRAPPPVKEGPRVNDEIRIPQVQLVDQEGQNRGIVPIDEARQLAEEAGLDLVEIAPNSRPPVVKILDYGKFKFQSQKKAAEARKRQKTVEVKEIKMRPNIDTHDYEVKMRSARRFLEEGDKVKVTLRFRGRELAHQELGFDLLVRVRDELNEASKVEFEPKLEGRQMVMVLAPAPQRVPAARPAAQA
nr:translation initiation factor IF-3 [Propylenella binzhouense]